jgi:hypothetical protein
MDILHPTGDEGNRVAPPATNNVAGQVGPDHDGETLRVIERELAGTINVGAGGILAVPREDLDADSFAGEDLDLAAGQPKKIRRPDRREFIALSLASEFPTRLLLHKPKADGIEVEHYYIDKSLRGPIDEELKPVRVFLFYSWKTKTHGLWIVNVTLDNTWYESLDHLFKQPADFFTSNAIRVISDKSNSRYRVKFKPMPGKVTWPTKPTGELLGEALGASHIIKTPDHPVYRDLVEGAELT